MKTIISSTQLLKAKKPMVGQIIKAPHGELYRIYDVKGLKVWIESTLPGQKVENVFRLP